MRGMGLAGKYPDMFDAYEAPYEVAELTIDICVCTYRRPSIEDTLRSLDRQTLPDGVSARAIVIDNDETPSARDRVEAIAANLSMPVKYIHAPANNISIARNAGLDAATAQWIAFIDDDEVAEPDWLASLLQMARVNSLDAVFGPAIAVYPETAPNWMRQQDYHSNVPVRRGGVVQTGHTCNALMRASSPIVKGQRFLIEKGKTGGEDTEFFFRLWYAGAKFGISEAAIVHEAVGLRMDSPAQIPFRNEFRLPLPDHTQHGHADHYCARFAGEDCFLLRDGWHLLLVHTKAEFLGDARRLPSWLAGLGLQHEGTGTLLSRP